MTSPLLITALEEVFAQGELLLSSLTDAAYVQKIPQAQNSSIGAHYRHSLEHCQAVLDHLSQTSIDYDARVRSVPLETDRNVALAATRTYRSLLPKLDVTNWGAPLQVRCQASTAEKEQAICASSVEREVLFIISHAIHHYALIRLLCSWQDISLPEGVGVAPSTQHHREVSR